MNLQADHPHRLQPENGITISIDEVDAKTTFTTFTHMTCRTKIHKGLVKNNYYLFVDGCNDAATASGGYGLRAKATISRADFQDVNVLFNQSNSQCAGIPGGRFDIVNQIFHHSSYPTSFSPAGLGNVSNTLCGFSHDYIISNPYSQCFRCRTRISLVDDVLQIT